MNNNSVCVCVCMLSVSCVFCGITLDNVSERFGEKQDVFAVSFEKRNQTAFFCANGYLDHKVYGKGDIILL